MKEALKEALKEATHDPKDLLQKQLALLVVNELGKQINLSGNTELVKGLFNIIVWKGDIETKHYASIALGGVSSGNLEKVLPDILSVIKQDQENNFLMLNTLKEIISINHQFNQDTLKTILPFLFEQAATKDESLRNILSECIGRLGLINMAEISGYLKNAINNQNIYTRATAYSAFKYLT